MLHIPDMQFHTGEKHYREYVNDNFGNIFKQFLKFENLNDIFFKL